MTTSETLEHSSNLRDEASRIALVGASLLGYYVCPNMALAAIATAALLYLVWQRLDLGLIAVLVTAPFYRFPKSLDLSMFTAPLGRSAALEVSLAEYVLTVCAVAWVIRLVKQPHTYWNKPVGGDPTYVGQPAAATQSPARGEPVESMSPTHVVFTDPRIWLPPAVLVAVALISLLFTENKQVALRELRVIILEPCIFYMLVMDTIRTPRDVTRFLWAFVALGLGIGAFSVYHYIFVGTVESTGGVGRALAVYHSPNALALFLGRVMPVAAALGFAAWMVRSEVNREKKMLFAALSLLAMAAAFYITYSRGAFIGLGAAGLVLLFGLNRRSAVLAVGATVVLAIAAYVVVPHDRLLAETPLVQRLYVWEAALNMAKDHPLTGVGMDNFLYNYPKYMLPQAALEPNISHAHNVFLDFWTRLGILGLVTLVGIQGHFWWHVKELLGRSLSPAQRWLVLGSAASMMDFLVHGLIDNSYFLIDLAFVFWLTLALVSVLERATRPDASVPA